VPAGAPLFSGPEDPALAKTIGVLFLIFVVGAALQVRRMRAAGRIAAGRVRPA
jgi:Kef-type K+ transport system membrane component KefB